MRFSSIHIRIGIFLQVVTGVALSLLYWIDLWPISFLTRPEGANSCHREPNKEQKTYNESHTVTLAHICTITLFQVEISSDHLALFKIS